MVAALEKRFEWDRAWCLKAPGDGSALEVLEVRARAVDGGHMVAVEWSADAPARRGALFFVERGGVFETRELAEAAIAEIEW